MQRVYEHIAVWKRATCSQVHRVRRERKNQFFLLLENPDAMVNRQRESICISIAAIFKQLLLKPLFSNTSTDNQPNQLKLDIFLKGE